MSEVDHTERFEISAESESETKTTVAARGFEFTIDEPAALDGTDDGPTPVEYLLGAWAGCLNVVAHTVAEERGIEIDGIDFDIGGDLDPRKLFGVSDDARAGFQEIRVQLRVASDEGVPAGFVEEVEDRCPVGDNIGNVTPTNVSVEIS
ncbi:OsmC family protein [Halorubrum sp. DTA98]|uniref:OsmC family protein n=1 Tax=Halorubrum sp. DTA98 TaxID=3402163 RepID=UPI003AAF9E17